MRFERIKPASKGKGQLMAIAAGPGSESVPSEGAPADSPFAHTVTVDIGGPLSAAPSADPAPAPGPPGAAAGGKKPAEQTPVTAAEAALKEQSADAKPGEGVPGEQVAGRVAP